MTEYCPHCGGQCVEAVNLANFDSSIMMMCCVCGPIGDTGMSYQGEPLWRSAGCFGYGSWLAAVWMADEICRWGVRIPPMRWNIHVMGDFKAAKTVGRLSCGWSSHVHSDAYAIRERYRQQLTDWSLWRDGQLTGLPALQAIFRQMQSGNQGLRPAFADCDWWFHASIPSHTFWVEEPR
jgi:hypothetical protein